MANLFSLPTPEQVRAQANQKLFSQAPSFGKQAGTAALGMALGKMFAGEDPAEVRAAKVQQVQQDVMKQLGDVDTSTMAGVGKVGTAFGGALMKAGLTDEAMTVMKSIEGIIPADQETKSYKGANVPEVGDTIARLGNKGQTEVLVNGQWEDIKKHQGTTFVATTKDVTMSLKEMEQGKKAASSAAGWDTLVGNYDDSYAGFTVPGTSAVAMEAGKRLGGEYQAMAEYWSDYQRQKNVIRNLQFGSQLTVPEMREFEKTQAGPQYDSGFNKNIIKREAKLAKSIAKQYYDYYKSKGLGNAAIKSALGPAYDLATSRSKSKLPKGVSQELWNEMTPKEKAAFK